MIFRRAFDDRSMAFFFGLCPGILPKAMGLFFTEPRLAPGPDDAAAPTRLDVPFVPDVDGRQSSLFSDSTTAATADARVKIPLPFCSLLFLSFLSDFRPGPRFESTIY